MWYWGVIHIMCKLYHFVIEKIEIGIFVLENYVAVVKHMALYDFFNVYSGRI